MQYRTATWKAYAADCSIPSGSEGDCVGVLDGMMKWSVSKLAENSAHAPPPEEIY